MLRRIWRRKRREREARYHQLDPLLEGPWVKTKVFDPYAETDFRTPTNQLEFEVTTPNYNRNSFNSSLPPTPGYSMESSNNHEQVRYADDEHRDAGGALLNPRDSMARSRAPSGYSDVSGYSDATVVGDEEVRKMTPSYGSEVHTGKESDER